MDPIISPQKYHHQKYQKSNLIKKHPRKYWQGKIAKAIYIPSPGAWPITDFTPDILVHRLNQQINSDNRYHAQLRTIHLEHGILKTRQTKLSQNPLIWYDKHNWSYHSTWSNYNTALLRCTLNTGKISAWQQLASTKNREDWISTSNIV